MYRSSAVDAFLILGLLATSSDGLDCLYPCVNGGVCVDGDCACPSAYTGPTCAIELCDLPCENNGTCYNTSNGFQCLCSPGYDGPYCQHALSECGVGHHFCYNNGSCVSGSCTCQHPHIGDSCHLSLCTTKRSCGSDGMCLTGSTLSPDFSGIVVGDHCYCGPGSTGEHCETPMEQCGSNVCYNNGRCVDGSCVCPPPYSGDECVDTTAIESCGPYGSYTCLNGGECINNSCVCVPPFTGIDCGIGVCDLQCLNNGTCFNYDLYEYCSCHFGFTGQYCEIGLEPCGPGYTYVCHNGGTCVDGSCMCTHNYTGHDCSYLICPYQEPDFTLCVFHSDNDTSVPASLPGPICPSSIAGLESSISTVRDLTTVIGIVSSTGESTFLMSTSGAGSRTMESSLFSPTVNPSARSDKYGASPTLPADLSNSLDTINIESSSPFMPTPSVSSYQELPKSMISGSMPTQYSGVTVDLPNSAQSTLTPTSVIRDDTVTQDMSSSMVTTSVSHSKPASSSILSSSSSSQSLSSDSGFTLTLQPLSSLLVDPISTRRSVATSPVQTEVSQSSVRVPTPSVTGEGFCDSEVTDVRGAVVQWPQTLVGQVAAVPCPCMGGSGKTISRRCGQDGLWGEVDETQCEIKLSYYVRRLCGVKDSNKQVEILMNMTSSNMSLTSNDVVFLTDMIQHLSKISAIIGEATRMAIMHTLDSILAVDEMTMRNASRMNVGQKVLDVVQTVVSSFKVGLNDSQVIVMNNIELEVAMLGRSVLQRRGFKRTNKKSTVSIPPEFFSRDRGNSTGSASTSMFRLGLSTFSNRGLFSAQNANKRFSDILIVDVGTLDSPVLDISGLNSNEMVKMTFEMQQFTSSPNSVPPTDDPPECSFFDATAGEWSTRGCVLELFSGNTVQCACNHLTAFAVIQSRSFDMHDTPSGDTPTGDTPSGDSNVYIIAGSSAGGVLLLVIVMVTIAVVGLLYSKYRPKTAIVMDTL